MIDIVENEDLIYHINEYDGIIIGTNCYQVMRHGFQYDVSRNYPYVLEANYNSKYGDINKLGTIIECKEDKQPLFILAFISFGFNFKGGDTEFLDYQALQNCLRLLNLTHSGSHYAMTFIGSTPYDGNGNKDKILKIINSTVKSFDLTIYDYYQTSHNTKIRYERRTKRYNERCKRVHTTKKKRKSRNIKRA